MSIAQILDAQGSSAVLEDSATLKSRQMNGFGATSLFTTVTQVFIFQSHFYAPQIGFHSALGLLQPVSDI